MDTQLESLIFLLQNTTSPIWGIWTSDNKRVQEFKGESLDDSISFLKRVFPFLERKRFEFRYRPLNSNEKGQFYQNFDLTEKKVTNSTLPQLPQINGMSMEMFLFLTQIQEKCTRLELKIEAIEKNYEKLDREIDTIYRELSDEDPKNDKTAIEKLGKIMDSAPSIMSSIKSAKELF